MSTTLHLFHIITVDSTVNERFVIQIFTTNIIKNFCVSLVCIQDDILKLLLNINCVNTRPTFMQR